MYLVFDKRSAGITKVKPLEVGTYGDLAPRSKKDIDHIPSLAALIKATETLYRRKLTKDQVAQIKRTSVGIAIPSKVHQKCSETYDGRNKLEKQQADAEDLKKSG
ncbi:hypothetical protein ACIL2N_003188 [Vibrio metschnikovii]